MPIERRLAAIMFTDIAGYTALSAKDSTKASKLLTTQRDTLKPIVEKHGGSWMKEIGDGLLLTFDSATSAVECSIAIQEATKDIEDLNLRIGIHEGEVIKQDGDVIGDDVNVASRIEPFSAIGGVAISQKVQQAISSNSEFETKYIGKPKLKGVSQNVEVYCITSHELPETDRYLVSKKLSISNKTKNIILTIALTIFGIVGFIGWYIFPFITLQLDTIREYDKSIAITYFDFEGDSSEYYWSLGLTDELISKVSKFENIKVSSKMEVDINRIKYSSILDIRNDLKVDYLLKGRIIKYHNQIKISANLIDTKNESIVWSETYNRNIENILELQTEIANQIIVKLSDKFDEINNYRDVINTDNFEAYREYLTIISKMKNTFLYNSEDKLIKKIDKILKLDSNYVEALSTKCFLLWHKIIVIIELSRDEDNYRINLNTSNLSDISDIINEIRPIVDHILINDPSNKLGLISKAGILIMESFLSRDIVALLKLRNAIAITKEVVQKYPDDIISNIAMAKIYELKNDYTPFSSSGDISIINTYLNHIIKLSERYLLSENIDYISLISFSEAYYLYIFYNEVELSEQIRMYNTIFDIMRNNHSIKGQRAAKIELFIIAKEEEDYENAITISKEIEALSKLMDDSKAMSWLYIDLGSFYYSHYNNRSLGLEYYKKGLEIYEGGHEVGWRRSYTMKLIDGAQYNRAQEQINIMSKYSLSALDSLDLFYAMGYINYSMENFKEAIINFENARLLFYEDYNWRYKNILYSLGNSYLESGHYNKSIHLYEKCLTLAKNQNDWIYWLNIKLALTYIKKGEIGKSKIYYQISKELYSEVDTKHFWDLYKINKLYQNTVSAISYLDSSYIELINKSNYYTNIDERNLYLTFDKYNKRIQKEWEKVNE